MKSNDKQTLEVKMIDTGKTVLHVHKANIQRPQLTFEPINNSKEPFIPKITKKYNAMVSLEESEYYIRCY